MRSTKRIYAGTYVQGRAASLRIKVSPGVKLSPGFLWLIEWPERAAGRLPQADLQFRFAIVGDSHRIERIETFKPTK
jgi:tRNA A37 threonylcarbamoyladenosine biosynthesis protein TsaE